MPQPAMLLTHGAGSDAEAPLLRKIATELEGRGWLVERYTLPFRRKRPKGPPGPGDAAADRAGLREAAAALRARAGGPLVLSGHSYGGRQASILASEEPGAADQLVLWSYPLHPPNKPDQPRTAHFADLRTPVVFVSGDRDEFGTTAELAAAVKLVAGPARLEVFPGLGHGLSLKADFSRVYEILLP
jgi:predicted alpha/beta-hydrolase family hydrolase